MLSLRRHVRGESAEEEGEFKSSSVQEFSGAVASRRTRPQTAHDLNDTHTRVCASRRVASPAAGRSKTA